MDNFEGPLFCLSHRPLMAMYSNIKESVLTSYLYETQINKVKKCGLFPQVTFVRPYRLAYIEKTIRPCMYLSLLLFSCQVMSNSLWPPRLQYARLHCSPPSPWVCSSLCPLSRWCYLTISSSVTLFFFCLKSFPASGSFSMSHLFKEGGQNIEASASALVLPMNIQGWLPLDLTGLVSIYETK